jgi:hypothetical protein
MTEKAHYERIGLELARLGSSDTSRLLAYSEVWENSVSVSVFIASGPEKVVYKYPTPELENAVYEFWQEWRTTHGNSEWRIMEFFLDGSKFKVTFAYPDRVDEEEDRFARRRASVIRQFGQVEIDYPEF